MTFELNIIRTVMRKANPNCPLHADIHSVSPHEGSTEGGTLVTVSGSGFGTNVSDIEVDVDGIPCHVMTHNMTHIQCWTGRPRDDDLSVADGDGGYSVTDSGHRFRGNVHSHTVIHPFFHTSILSQCLPHLDRHLHFLYAHTHSIIFSFSHSVILLFSHALILHSVILSYTHSPILSYTHTLRFTWSQLQDLSRWNHTQLRHTT